MLSASLCTSVKSSPDASATPTSSGVGFHMYRQYRDPPLGCLVPRDGQDGAEAVGQFA